MYVKKYSLQDRFDYHQNKSRSNPEKNGYSVGFVTAVKDVMFNFLPDDKELEKIKKYQGFNSGFDAGLNAWEKSQKVKF